MKKSSSPVSFTILIDVFWADDIVSRYEALQAQIAERLAALQRALAQCMDVKEQLDILLRWLDEAERNTHKMEKGTLIAVKREPLLQNMQGQKVTD